MANKTIPDLIEVTSPNTTDFLVIQNSGTTKKIQLLNIVPSSSITSSKLANASVTNNKLATVGAYTIKGRNESTSGSPEDLTVNQVKDMLGFPSTPFLTSVNVLSSDTLNLYWDAYTTSLSGNVIIENVSSQLSGTLVQDISATILNITSSQLSATLTQDISASIVTVKSVNSKTGVVLLTASDVGAAFEVHTHPASAISFLPFELGLAISDETTILTTGTAKTTFRMPRSVTLTSIKGSVGSASTSGAIQVDVNKNGSSILSTKLTIDETQKTSTTSSVPVVISDSNLTDDSEITVDVDSAGTNATGLKIWLLGTRA
jgi:hypothetical protein